MSEFVRRYSPEDRETVFEIMRGNFNRDLTIENKLYFDWLEKLSGHDSPSDNGSLVVETDGRVTAYLSVIPCKFKIANQTIDTGFVFDVISDPNKRGVGIKLLRKIVYSDFLHFGAPGLRVETLWSKLAKNETDNIVVDKLVKVISILDPNAFLMKKNLPLLLVNTVSNVWKTLLRVNVWISSALKSSKGLVLSKQIDFPNDVDELWDEFCQDFYGIALKNKAFLDWRFSQSPYQYQKLLLRKNHKLLGYLIYREGYINGRKDIVIVEAIATGDKLVNYTLMLNYLFKEALQSGISGIQTNLSGCPFFGQALKSKWFVKRPADTASIISNHSYYKHIEANENTKQWFFSIADSDFEFANFKLDISA